MITLNKKPIIELDTVFGGCSINSPIYDILGETPFFSCDIGTVYKNCGPYTKKILDCVLKHSRRFTNLSNTLIDVRVQRLMPGMYPGIPGWHCDHVPRDNEWVQPDFYKVNESLQSMMLIMADQPGGVSRTQFLRNPLSTSIEPKDGNVYKLLHKEIEQSLLSDEDKISVESGKLYLFNSLNPHRAMPATSRGNRLFFRISEHANPKVLNVINPVQQAYVLSEEEGW